MADVNLKNLARMTVSSTGAGTITLNLAVSGFLTFDLAGCSTAAAGSIVRYAISDTTKSEFAYGTYTSSSLTLTRGSSTTGMKSTNADSPIDMSTAAQVFITDSFADHPFVVDTTGSPITYTLSQNGITAVTVSNTNAGAAANARFTANSDAGSLAAVAYGSGAASNGGLVWSGSGSFLIDAQNATGNILMRTGAGPTNALTISSTQAVAIPGTLAVTDATASTSTVTGALKVTGGVGVGGSVFANKFSGANQPCFSAHRNGADLAGIATGTDTNLECGNETFDIGSYYNAATFEWTPPAGAVYVAGAVYMSAGLTASSLGSIRIYKNGALYKTSHFTATSAGTGGSHIGIVDRANGADTYSLYVNITTAGTGTAEGDTNATWFMGLTL